MSAERQDTRRTLQGALQYEGPGTRKPGIRPISLPSVNVAPNQGSSERKDAASGAPSVPVPVRVGEAPGPGGTDHLVERRAARDPSPARPGRGRSRRPAPAGRRPDGDRPTGGSGRPRRPRPRAGRRGRRTRSDVPRLQTSGSVLRVGRRLEGGEMGIREVERRGCSRGPACRRASGSPRRTASAAAPPSAAMSAFGIRCVSGRVDLAEPLGRAGHVEVAQADAPQAIGGAVPAAARPRTSASSRRRG